MTRIKFSKRNSPNPKRNDLEKFERFHAILLSLRDSTEITVEITELIKLTNGKYYLEFPVNVAEALVNKVVLRRENLTTIDVLVFYGVAVDWGRVEPSTVDEHSTSCVIVLNEQAS